MAPDWTAEALFVCVSLENPPKLTHCSWCQGVDTSNPQPGLAISGTRQCIWLIIKNKAPGVIHGPVVSLFIADHFTRSTALPSLSSSLFIHPPHQELQRIFFFVAVNSLFFITILRSLFFLGISHINFFFAIHFRLDTLLNKLDLPKPLI